MRHLEDSLQMNCVKWMRLQYPHEASLLHHSPNGGRRDLREAARFKAMGVSAGFPDLILCIPSHGYHGLCLELKTQTGRQSAMQKEWQKRLSSQGYLYAVIRSFDEFRTAINNYLRIDTEYNQGI